jgi:hypothetical protein
MAMASGSRPDPLAPGERDRIERFRAADELADLVELVGAADEHDAYFAAKEDWRDLRGAELDAEPPARGLPGTSVSVGDTIFHVHGVTHAGTDAERDYLREHVEPLLDGGAAVYCEQGIRSMYFDDLPGVCEVDDYRWAMRRCKELPVDSHIEEFPNSAVDDLVEDVTTVAAQFREATFSLIEDNTEVYGEDVADVLGDVAAAFLMSHENVATGQDFASFALSERAAENPTRLGELQRYYERSFLPQPLEREWLARHDPELELVTHARNARMADYIVYQADDADDVHLVTGAAHQPGVRYYLEAHRDGERDLEGFQPV